MLSNLARRLADLPGLPSLVEQRAYPGRLAPGRGEYSFIEFMIFVVVLVGLTFLYLKMARSYRARRDERLTASSGGWRIRSQLGFDAGSPYNRFSFLELRMPHDVREGQEDGFEVSYFRGRTGRYSGVKPHALVQLPVDPPRMRYVATDTPAGGSIGDWGPRASQVLRDARDVVVETAPLALMVTSYGASPEDVRRIALALAKAVVEDAQGSRPAIS